MKLRAKRKSLLPANTIACLLTSACFGGGERVGSASAVTATSLLPASVPYYLDLCGQDGGPSPRYRLIAPAGLDRWKRAEDVTINKEADAKRRASCADRRRIENGDPITIRLHRVGIAGLAQFDKTGQKCLKGCKRDVAIVLDFNGSETLQKPIVAFYQRDVRPDSNLQFSNFTIFTQNEWFHRFPPSVRVRLYDVRDDKDEALHAQLDAVRKGANTVLAYVAGAAVAGPIVDTATEAAKRLTDGPRNRAILDMSFQLYPEDTSSIKQPEGQAAKPLPKAADFPGDELTKSEISFLQDLLTIDKRSGPGTIGPRTREGIARTSQLKDLPEGSTAFNQQVRLMLLNERGRTGTPGDGSNDSTFAAPIFASQFIVFNEDASVIGGATPSTASCSSNTSAARGMLGSQLPTYWFVPDGVLHGGARVVAEQAGDSASNCVMETPYVVFAITRESGAVAADVAKRLSDLQTKFGGQAIVSEDAITTLTGTLADAQLALAIDRLENIRRAGPLKGLINRLLAQYGDHERTPANGEAAPPLPGASYRTRAFRLISDYSGCPVSDDGTIAALEKAKTYVGKFADNDPGDRTRKPILAGASETCITPKTS